MAPTKNAQRLRRVAERKGKAEDQYHSSATSTTPGGRGSRKTGWRRWRGFARPPRKSTRAP